MVVVMAVLAVLLLIHVARRAVEVLVDIRELAVPGLF
jgi:hypothetical protein